VLSVGDADGRDGGAEVPAPARGSWIVDAMNVIGSRPDGWWRDRDGALRRLVARTVTWARTVPDAEVVVVADGSPVDELPEGPHGPVVVRYASRRGRDAADDRIVELVGDLAPAAGTDPVVVVTADRELRSRVEELGAATVGPRTFRHHLDAADGA
jgi:predicted RNA-binding protein with PIN domain